MLEQAFAAARDNNGKWVFTRKTECKNNCNKPDKGAILNRSYKSDLAAAIHDTCETLHEHGLIDHEKMREFDDTCLICKNHFTPEKIAALRMENHVSRAVFARHLGVAREEVEAWEKGEKEPGGPECRLLALIARDGFEILKL